MTCWNLPTNLIMKSIWRTSMCDRHSKLLNNVFRPCKSKRNRGRRIWLKNTMPLWKMMAPRVKLPVRFHTKRERHKLQMRPTFNAKMRPEPRPHRGKNGMLRLLRVKEEWMKRTRSQLKLPRRCLRTTPSSELSTLASRSKCSWSAKPNARCKYKRRPVVNTRAL